MQSVAIIDDDDVFSEALADKLSHHDVKVEQYTAANAFLEKAESGGVDLAIVDLTMTDSRGVYWEFAGVEVVRAVRKAAGDGIPIWVLTGNDMPHMLSACLINGANDFLSKDEGISEICHRVASTLKVRAAR